MMIVLVRSSAIHSRISKGSEIILRVIVIPIALPFTVVPISLARTLPSTSISFALAPVPLSLPTHAHAAAGGGVRGRRASVARGARNTGSISARRSDFTGRR